MVSYFGSSPLLAAPTCVARPSSLDERFGLMLLGTKIQDVSKDARLKTCTSGGQCVFRDEIGVVYESDDSVIIDSKGFDLPAAKRNDFPLGLTSEDVIADFMRKIIPEDDAYASIFKNGPDKIIVLSGPCYANAKGIVFQIMGTFTGEGRLSGVGVATAVDVKKTFEFRDRLLKQK
jgi:hypothetical protein